MPSYRITYVMPGGGTKAWSTAADDTAPGTDKLSRMAVKRKANAVIRFWPSKRGWRIIDTRKGFLTGFTGQRFEKVEGCAFVDRVFLCEDSAVMYATHKLS